MFKRIYFSGCSHTAGGGLEHTRVREFYEEQGITYNDTRLVAYPSVLAKEFEGIDMVDHSLGGTGAIRLIREAHRWIEEVGLDEARKTLFILQFNESPMRVSHWSNALNDYFMMFVTYDDKNKPQGNMLDIWLGKKKWTPLQYLENYEIPGPYIKYLYNPVEYAKEIRLAIIGFLGFLKINDIDFIFTCEDLKKEEFVPKLNEHRFFADGENSVYKYSLKHKITINDIVPNVDDGHPSIQAHREYAALLIEHIKQKYF